jgi:hypothetical protein
MSIMKDGVEVKSGVDNEEIVVAANAALGRIKAIVDNTRQELTKEIHSAYGISSPEVRSTVVKASVTSHFVNLLANTPAKVASAEARRAWRLRK